MDVLTEPAPTSSAPRTGIGLTPEDAQVANSRTPTVGGVLKGFLRDPARTLLARWNWKSAVLSSLIRASIFFFTNLLAGWHAAVGAMLAELALRSVTSGFCGSVTQAFASARPVWAATVAAMLVLPCLTHSLEFLVHWLRHTPKLGLSIGTSVIFTAISTAFNLYAMHHGTLTVGDGSRPLAEDLSRVPKLLLGFVTAGPRAIVCSFRRKKATVEMTPSQS